MLAEAINLPARLTTATRWLWVWLAIAGLLIALPYRHLLQRGYTDRDDFEEVDRALVVDIPDPSRIFLTAHEGNRYRPLDRLVNTATIAVGHAVPVALFARNLALHLANAMLVGLIVFLLARNELAAVAATALFGLHPATVNVVGVAIFAQSFSACLVLVGVLLSIAHWQRGLHRVDWRLYIATTLFAMVIFSNEMFLWVGPVYVLALAWAYRASGGRKGYLALVGVMLVAVATYLSMRQMVVQHSTLVSDVGSDRYGLRSPAQIVQNVAMFLASGGMVVDYLFLINPLRQTLPIAPRAMLSSGVIVPVAISAVLALATLVSAALYLRRRDPRLATAAIFVVLFFVSNATVNLMTSASETHLYLSLAFLTIAQALLLSQLTAILIRNRYRKTLMILFVLVCLTIIVRGAGVERRNTMLLEKSTWVARLQDDLRLYSGEAQQNELTFIIGCNAPRGYSIYGLNRFELLAAPEFIKSTLGAQGSMLKTTALYAEQMDSQPSLPARGVLSVGGDGTIHPYTQAITTSCGS
jgi:hypothetical protein